MGHILRMQPVLHEKIWGGSALHDIYGYEIPSDHTGEAWVISAHPNGDCKIAEGEFKGQYSECKRRCHQPGRGVATQGRAQQE